MPDAVRGKDTLGYLGTPAVNPSNVIVADRAPVAKDDNLPIGTTWIDPVTNKVFILTSILPSTRSKWISLSA